MRTTSPSFSSSVSFRLIDDGLTANCFASSSTGTLVLAYDEETGEKAYKPVVQLFKNETKRWCSEGHFRALYDLYEKNELTSAINRVVEDVNHRFTLDVLTKDFMSHDLGISARNLRNDRQNSNDILDRIDKEEFTKRLKNLLEIRNKEEQIVTISEDHRR